MEFNSIPYLTFLGSVVLLWSLIPDEKVRQWLLLASSLTFYAIWSPIFLILLIGVILLSWIGGQLIHKREGHKSLWVGIGITLCLLVLFIFKYLNFTVEILNQALGNETFSLTKILLPVGISFYIFQAMSFLIDVKRGLVSSQTSFREVALYISFFPQLVAGPIVRAKEFLPQLKESRSMDPKRFHTGLFFIGIGLVQKCFVADLLGYLYVDSVYAGIGSSRSGEVLVAFYAFPFQLYNDFAGYSHIAIGSALLIGYVIPINFNAPFLSQSPAEFWSRWHISLSNWVRDYVFYPLIFSSWFKKKQAWCIVMTMLLIGLWHGAAWNFILFGAVHAILSVIYHFLGPRFKKVKFASLKWVVFVHYLVFVHIIFISLVIFRMHNLDDLGLFFSRMLEGFSLESPKHILIWLIALGSHVLLAKHFDQISRFFSSSLPLLLRFIFYVIVGVMVVHSVSVNHAHKAFIYFQF